MKGTITMDRRTLIATAAFAPLLALPGCATTGGGFNLVEAIRRLLGISAERAFASLLRENGFFDSAVARIDVPDALGGVKATSIVSAILRSGAFRDRLARQLNRAAEKGAALAAPVVTEAITSLSVADALAVVRGGPRAATDVLQSTLGPRLFEAMVPGIGDGLRLFDSQVVQQALKQVTRIDFAGLRDDVTRMANDGIYRAIGTEEAAIRANPSATGDPLLTAVFTLTR
jgi:Protein of unknown function (DUF4197)